MASTYGSPVLFTKEKNVWTLSCRLLFGANGTVTLDPMESKGFCAAFLDPVTFSGNTVASSASVSSITSFAGLFNGMTVTGSTSVGAGVTVSSMNANTGVLTLSSGTNVLTQPGNLLQATGGRYRVQFGQQAGVRLDAYVKVMGFNCDWRETTGTAAGSATSLQFSPTVTNSFMVQNNIKVRTIPQTLTSGSTDASVAIQFGTYSGGLFTVATPKPGEVAHFTFILGNSTAP